jgi:DNA-binding response OmpR family regulator
MPMLRTLLIVEDQHDLAELVALHLSDLAQRIHLCGDGVEALRIAAATPPDLVVLDLGLPGLDGLEVCRRLRASARYVPILMLTSRSSDAERVLGLELGADDYLVKPFNVMELVARAKAIVRGWMAWEATAMRHPSGTLRSTTHAACTRRTPIV